MSNISLLREKFTIREYGMDAIPVIALGNRLKVDLPGEHSPLIIRGHSMHITLRYGAELLKQIAFYNHIENVETLFKWENIWENIIAPFEENNVPKTWICIYHSGKIIFNSGKHHPFFDVIEHAEFKNAKSQDGYEQSIEVAQKAFKQMGKSVMIEQESNVGFVLDEGDDEMRFAITLRTPMQKSTFIMRMREDKNNKLKPSDYSCMQMSADYIEAINISVQSGFIEAEIDKGNIKKFSKEMKEYKSFQKRIQKMVMNIEQIEKKYKINYRPERPEFHLIQEECKEFSKQ